MGESAGHPFRGNQWTGGQSGGRGDVRVSRGDYLSGPASTEVREGEGAPVPEEPSRPGNPAAWARRSEIIAIAKDGYEGKIPWDIAVNRIREHTEALRAEHGVTVERNLTSYLNDEERERLGIKAPDERFLAMKQIADAETEGVFHSYLAQQPEGVIEHLKNEGYVVKSDISKRAFQVGDGSFDEAAHVNYRTKEVVFRVESLNGVNGQISEGVLYHEFGHVGVEVLAGRIAAARVAEQGEPGAEISDVTGYPKVKTPKIEAAEKYLEKMEKSLRHFDLAYQEEGGVTSYSKSYKDSKMVDMFKASPSAKGLTLEEHASRTRLSSISRGANENFAELMGKFRLFQQDTHTASVKMFVQALKEMHPDKPKTIDAFAVLLKDVGRKSPRWMKGIKIEGKL